MVYLLWGGKRKVLPLLGLHKCDLISHLELTSGLIDAHKFPTYSSCGYFIIHSSRRLYYFAVLLINAPFVPHSYNHFRVCRGAFILYHHLTPVVERWVAAL